MFCGAAFFIIIIIKIVKMEIFCQVIWNGHIPKIQKCFPLVWLLSPERSSFQSLLHSFQISHFSPLLSLPLLSLLSRPCLNKAFSRTGLAGRPESPQLSACQPALREAQARRWQTDGAALSPPSLSPFSPFLVPRSLSFSLSLYILSLCLLCLPHCPSLPSFPQLRLTIFFLLSTLSSLSLISLFSLSLSFPLSFSSFLSLTHSLFSLTPPLLSPSLLSRFPGVAYFLTLSAQDARGWKFAREPHSLCAFVWRSWGMFTELRLWTTSTSCELWFQALVLFACLDILGIFTKFVLM